MVATEENGKMGFIKEIKGVLERYKVEIGLGLLIIYVILLGIGTIAEVFQIRWILDWPIFRSPGRYKVE